MEYGDPIPITMRSLPGLANGYLALSAPVENTGRWLGAWLRLRGKAGASVGSSPALLVFLLAGVDNERWPLSGQDTAIALPTDPPGVYARSIPVPTANMAIVLGGHPIADHTGGVLPPWWRVGIANATGAALAKAEGLWELSAVPWR